MKVEEQGQYKVILGSLDLLKLNEGKTVHFWINRHDEELTFDLIRE